MLLRTSNVTEGYLRSANIVIYLPVHPIVLGDKKSLNFKINLETFMTRVLIYTNFDHFLIIQRLLIDAKIIDLETIPSKQKNDTIIVKTSQYRTLMHFLITFNNVIDYLFCLVLSVTFVP